MTPLFYKRFNIHSMSSRFSQSASGMHEYFSTIVCQNFESVLLINIGNEDNDGGMETLVVGMEWESLV